MVDNDNIETNTVTNQLLLIAETTRTSNSATKT